MVGKNPPPKPKDSLGPDDLVRNLTQLPSSPAVLPRLMDILRDNMSALEDSAALIKLDSGIAARVLQMANSSYYGKRERCYDVEEAVGRVGVVKVYELVAFAATAPLLMRRLATYEIEADDLWRLSVTCALASEQLAVSAGYDVNIAYTTGLLHGAGMVAVDLWAAGQPHPLRLRHLGLPDESTADEKRLIGFTSANVAAALLKSWGFASAVIEPVRWQYDPRFAGGHVNIACGLHVAKWLRDAVHVADDAPRPPMPQQFALDHLRLTKDDLEAYRTEVKEAWAHAVELLDESPEGAAE
jgi:HD-like signal output (HDOD) protein